MADDSKFCIACGAKLETSGPVQESAAQEAAVSVEGSAAVTEEAAYPNTPTPPPAPPVQAQPKPASAGFTPVSPQPAQPVQQQPKPSPANYPPAAPQPVMPAKPEKTEPLPVWKYIGIFLLRAIPIVGIVMIFVWAFGSSCNRNTKNYARAVLITFVIFLVLSLVGYLTIWPSVQEIINNLMPSGGLPVTG
jgi:hypothetical protein